MISSAKMKKDHISLHVKLNMGRFTQLMKVQGIFIHFMLMMLVVIY